MKRKFLSLLLTICMLVSMFPTGAWAAEAYNGGTDKLSVYDLDGDGTAENPYKISSRENLETLADAVNGGNTLQGMYFLQTGDINLGGKDDPWPVIGHVVGNTPHPFNGVYDGGNFKISGLFVGTMDGTTDEDDDPVGVENEDAGLFGHVGEKGIIRRVHVVDCKVYNKALYVGGIAGRNEGLVEYCSSDATDPDNSSGVVSGSWQYAGGIVGYNFGTISYCYSNCDVYGAQKVGGITGGQNGGTVANCYFRGYVYASDITRAYAGGIAGENDGDSAIDNCYSDGIVEGRNDNAYCGAIAGSNDTGSTVGNCFWEDSDDMGLPGIGSGMGDVENVEQRTEDEFASGQVAWELAHGTDGDGWGQTLDRGEDQEPDRHPHFVGQPDKSEDTSAVYRVRLMTKENTITLYVDPDVDLDLTQDEYKLPENAKWYLVDENGDGILDENGEPMAFKGDVTTHDVDAVGGERILFAGQEDPYLITTTYSPEAQTVEINLDTCMQYAERGPSPEGRFEYTIDNDIDELGVDLDLAGNTLTIPKGANAGEYTLKVLAHEKKPFIAPLALLFDKEDVELTVNIVIEKATPVIDPRPTAKTIDYGNTLAASALTGGKAQHPTTGTDVPGSFAWADQTTIPTVNEAAITGYPVLFTPSDTNNYNPVTVYVTLTVNKVNSTILTPPTALDDIYNGTAQDLIKAGSATGGDMKYWLADDATSATPDPNAVYSSTVPARANAGTYRVWYMVIGDENHNDTKPAYIDVIISPYPLSIPAQEFIYDGTDTLTVTIDGATLENGSKETITVTLTASSKNEGTYTYNTGDDKYTAVIASPNDSNYAVGTAGDLTINKRPVILDWSKELVFVYEEGKRRNVHATVTNLVGDDDLKLVYEETGEDTNGSYAVSAIYAGNYIGKVSRLEGASADNYTLVGGTKTEQVWHIVQTQNKIDLLPTDPTYGDTLTLTADELTPNAEVSFYANGQLLGTVIADDITGKAVLEVDAVSANHLTAGANPVIAVYEGNSNIADSAAYATANIGPKSITATIIGTNSKVYDGDNIATGLELELEVCDEGDKNKKNKVENCDGDDVTASADSYAYDDKNAGESKTITANNVTLSGAQSGNYTITTPVETDGKIDPKVVKLEWRGVSDRVYNGTPSNVTATATELIPGDEVTVEVENGSETYVGEYKATAKSLSDLNYKLPDDSTTQNYKITPAPLYIPELRVTYNGTQKFIVDVGGANEEIQVHLTTSSANAGSYDYVESFAEGMYTATEDSSNYVIAGGAEVIIEKAVPDVTWPEAADIIYVNDDELTLEDFTAGRAEGVDKNDLAGAFAMAGETIWNQKGTYAVAFTFIPEDTTNYVSVTGDVTVNVVKRQVASAYKKTDITHKYYGTAEEDLELPTTVTITTKDGKVFKEVPVTWHGYDPNTLDEQKLEGTLDLYLADIADEVENPDNIKAYIIVKLLRDPEDPNDPTDPAPTPTPGPDDPTDPTPSPAPDTPLTPDPSGPVDDVPQTGDNSNLALWMTLMVLSLAGIVVTLFSQKKMRLFSFSGRHTK